MSRGKLGRKAVMNYHSQLASDLQIEPLFRRQHGTNSNTDTKNINISMGIVRDPKTRSVLRVNGLYLRGEKESELIVNQTQFTIRDEINISPRTFVFAQGNYVRDTFKGIRNLFSPT